MSQNLTETSSIERQNAVISYCFLGIFILMSRQERFQSHFINSHARVASIIQFLFVCLVIMTIFSGNFGSMLIFDFSLSNIGYFIGFILLLFALWMGIIRALQGKEPSFQIQSISLREISRRIAPTGVETIEKIPMILSHIPLMWNLIAAKYGASFYSGERFATWSLLVGLLFFWIDPSMTLVIIFFSLVTIWIIYQSISLAIDESISLVGDHLPTSKTVHIFLLTLTTYTWQLMSHTRGSLPDWWHTYSNITNTYSPEKNEKVSEIVAFPLVNIVYLIKNIHTVPVRSEILQWCSITVLFVVSILLVSPSLIFFTLFISYIGFLSLRYQHILAIPFIQEFSHLLIRCIRWATEKSKKETSTFTS